MRASSDEISGGGISSIDALGRRFRSEEYRRRIVGEALAPRARKRGGAITFVPITVVESAARQLPASNSAPTSEVVAPPAPGAKKRKAPSRRGVIEIALPDGARISVDAEVDEAALRTVLSAMKDA